MVAAGRDLPSLSAIVPGHEWRRRRRSQRDRVRGSIISSDWGSTPSGSRRSFPRRCGTSATTSATIATSIRSSDRLPISTRCSPRRTREALKSFSTSCRTTPRTSILGFRRAASSKLNPKRDWYVWRDPRPDGSPPNNWESEFGGPAWTFDEATGQYYYHAYLKEQPDLNWRNPEVERAMCDVLALLVRPRRRWLPRRRHPPSSRRRRGPGQPARSRLAARDARRTSGWLQIRTIDQPGTHASIKTNAEGRRRISRQGHDWRGLPPHRPSDGLLRRGPHRLSLAFQLPPDLDRLAAPGRSRRSSRLTRLRCLRVAGRTGCSATTTDRGSQVASAPRRRGSRQCSY